MGSKSPHSKTPPERTRSYDPRTPQRPSSSTGRARGGALDRYIILIIGIFASGLWYEWLDQPANPISLTYAIKVTVSVLYWYVKTPLVVLGNSQGTLNNFFNSKSPHPGVFPGCGTLFFAEFCPQQTKRDTTQQPLQDKNARAGTQDHTVSLARRSPGLAVSPCSSWSQRERLSLSS